jgi:hypothetical protein
MFDSPTTSSVINSLFGADHVLWYDFLTEVTTADGKKRLKLARRPVFTEGFLSFYGLGQEDLSQKKEFLSEMAVNPTERNQVLKSISRAIKNGDSPVSLVVRLKMKNGSLKTVLTYRRKVKLSDGSWILASLISEIKAPEFPEKRLQDLFDHLPCFVFVKQWNEKKNKFTFEYVNASLEKKFREIKNVDPRGRTDDDYMASDSEKVVFRFHDEVIRDTKDPNHRLVSDEWFTTKLFTTESDYRTLRLVTIKRPFGAVSTSGELKPPNKVLGIAVDVTSLTARLVDHVKLPEPIVIYFKIKPPLLFKYSYFYFQKCLVTKNKYLNSRLYHPTKTKLT